MVIYPEYHSDLNLGNVLFFNMAAHLSKLKMNRHMDAYFDVNLGRKLFLDNNVDLFFHQMMQYATWLTPHSKIKVLPPGGFPMITPLL